MVDIFFFPTIVQMDQNIHAAFQIKNRIAVEIGVNVQIPKFPTM